MLTLIVVKFVILILTIHLFLKIKCYDVVFLFSLYKLWSVTFCVCVSPTFQIINLVKYKKTNTHISKF